MKLSDSKRMLTGAILGAMLLGSAVMNCSLLGGDDDSDNLAILGLALASGNQAALRENEQALAAEAGINAAINAASQNGDIAFLKDLVHPEHAMAFADNRPQIIPTSITVTSGSCTGTFPNQSCSAVLSGSAACVGGGTATFSNYSYQYTYTGTSATSFSSDGNSSGQVTFSSCKITYANILNGQNDTATLDGPITVALTGTGGIQISGSTSTYSRNGSTTISNGGGFSIDGAAVSWSEGVSTSDYSMTLEILSASSTAAQIRTTLTGTFNWNGTTVATFNNEVRTSLCTISGTEISCTLQ
ncbi:MAG: hypothetical protein KDK37_02255 [Leptospiraceae bacterium]|nr:hypothetical protein [Leptospiraceae bacterium]